MKPAEVEKNKFFIFAKIKSGNVVWDFGCGTGRFVMPLIKEGCTVYATDKNKPIYGKHPLYPLYGGWPVEKVDKILLVCVLHYNKDEKGAILQKAYNQLIPGGSLVIIEPNPFNPFFYCLYFWRWLINSPCPRRWHNEKYMSSRLDLIDWLEVTGFTKVETKKYAWFPSKFGWLKLNEKLNRMPILGIMNAFNWVRAEK